MRAYRIVHRQWFDEKARPTMEKFLVQELRKTLFGERWKTFQHHWGPDGCWMPTEFDSLDDARHFIERIAAGNVRQDHVYTVVESK